VKKSSPVLDESYTAFCISAPLAMIFHDGSYVSTCNLSGARILGWSKHGKKRWQKNGSK